MHHGKRSGQGKSFGEDGLIEYDGEWKDDKYDGEGRHYNPAPSGSRERANIHDQESLNANWIKYTGQFKAGRRHSSGTLVFSNGERLVAKWHEGELTQEGRYHFNNGRITGIHGADEEFTDETLCYKTGLVSYKGLMKNGEFECKGTHYNEFPGDMRAPFDYNDFNLLGSNWVKYTGGFK